jgi:AraC family transcriptional regulator, positive regulator of tynA and feaB
MYDLVGALFTPPEQSCGSRHADKLFARVRGVIEKGYADPDFGPPEAAARTGNFATLSAQTVHAAGFNLH